MAGLVPADYTPTTNPTTPHMPLGNGSGFNSGPMKFLSARVKDQDGKKAIPHFTVDTKLEDGTFARDPQTYRDVSGDLFRVEIKSRTYEGKERHDWVFYLRDDETAYRLPLSPTFSSRDLINRFATLLFRSPDSPDFGGLKISYYQRKNGKDAFYLEQRGQKVDWYYQLEQMPQPYELKDPRTGEVVKRDYAEVDAFFEDVVSRIAKALGGSGEVTASGQRQDQGNAEQTEGGENAVGEGDTQGDNAANESAPEPTPAPAKPAPKPAPAGDEGGDFQPPF